MRIAIVIPIYGSAESLRACFESLNRQSYQDFEVIVVDDGSVPPIASQSVIAPAPITRYIAQPHPRTVYGRIPIRYVVQQHAGAPAARNRGARETESEFVLFLDADIVLTPRALERLVAALDVHPKASYAYSGFRFGWKRFPSFPFDADRLRRMPYIHTSALIRRAHFPGFDTSLQRFQDWDLWMTMLAEGHTGVHVPEILFTIRNTRGTMSRWIPSFVHRFPWKWIGWMPLRLRAYRSARTVIQQKHHLRDGVG